MLPVASTASNCSLTKDSPVRRCFRSTDCYLGIAIACAAGLFVGCDLSGEYERRFQETLVSAGQRAAFDQLLFAAESEVLGANNDPSGVKLRIPVAFTGATSLAAEPRAKPPFLPFPGFSYSLEKPLPDAGGQMAPAYVYFGAEKKGGEVSLDKGLEQLRALVATTFPSAAWADVSVNTPQGATATYKALRVSGPQDFEISGAIQKLEGKFEIYVVESPTHYAFIMFRAPTAQWQQNGLDSAIQAALGTVNVAAAAAAQTPPAGTPAAAAPAGA
jgi:hypothetical protein